MELRDYKPIYDGDRYCLMCRHVCPVERVTKREATSPHGWALLIASVDRGLVGWNEETVDTLYKCADCGLCQANCATDRPLPATIVAARAAVVKERVMPQSVVEMDEKLRMWGNPYGEVSEGDDTQGRVNDGGVEASSRVGLFVGAATRFGRPQTVEAAQALLNAMGYRRVLLSMGRSSVYLPYTVGLWDTARTLAQQTLDEIKAAGVTQVLTLSKEDAHAFKSVYPEIGVAVPEELQVVEFTAWLAAMVDQGNLRLEVRDLTGAVYHDPCHTPRLLETAAPTRRLVEALAGYKVGELFWKERHASPCGAIGGFEFTQVELAKSLAQARIAEARAAGASMLLTEDPRCAAHLSKYAEEMPVVNLIALVAERGARGEGRGARG
ncbi:MAG TPA: (Fe-S)-binding protein [Chloroflexia bacterium]|nr:(Fe-S)-binding protein [Chloroflexia bacterium]